MIKKSLKVVTGNTDKWIPKKAEFITQKIKDKYSVEVISKLPNMPSYKTIYNWINNYHRKIFNFKSPLKLQEIKNLFRDKKT